MLTVNNLSTVNNFLNGDYLLLMEIYHEYWFTVNVIWSLGNSNLEIIKYNNTKFEGSNAVAVIVNHY